MPYIIRRLCAAFHISKLKYQTEISRISSAKETDRTR